MNSGSYKTSKRRKYNKQLIIDNERKAMFLPVNDERSHIIKSHNINIKDLLLNIFDDKKIFYNSNIRFNR